MRALLVRADGWEKYVENVTFFGKEIVEPHLPHHELLVPDRVTAPSFVPYDFELRSYRCVGYEHPGLLRYEQQS